MKLNENFLRINILIYYYSIASSVQGVVSDLYL